MARMVFKHLYSSIDQPPISTAAGAPSESASGKRGRPSEGPSLAKSRDAVAKREGVSTDVLHDAVGEYLTKGLLSEPASRGGPPEIEALPNVTLEVVLEVAAFVDHSVTIDGTPVNVKTARVHLERYVHINVHLTWGERRKRGCG
jgi:transposase